MTVQELIALLQKVPAPTNTIVTVTTAGAVAAGETITFSDAGALDITPSSLDEDGGSVLITASA